MDNLIYKRLTDWLLEKDDPSVRYFTLREILGRNEADPEVIEARTAIMESTDVLKIFEGQTGGGYWNDPKKYMRRFDGTYWRFIYLLELGVHPADGRLQKAAAYLLDNAYSKTKRGFTNEKETVLPPCYDGYILWALLRCGFFSAHEVQDCIQGLLDRMRFNDGDADAENPDDGCIGRHTCIRGAVPVIRAFRELKKFDDAPYVQNMIDGGCEFLLKHHLYKRSHDLKKIINPRLTRLSFPNFYYPDFLQMLELLADLGYRDDRMGDALGALLKKQNGNGKCELERPCNERGKDDLFPVPVLPEEKGEESKWITLRALKVIRHML